MTVQQIMDLALANTHTKSGQVSATSLLKWFNASRKKVAKKIISDISENFFFQIWTIDAEDNTVAKRANGEYLFPIQSSTSAGMKKLQKLFIKGYSTDDYFTPCKEVDLRALPNDWLWYMANQPKNDPIYFIADSSFFIAPEFLAADLPAVPAGNKQIKCYGVASIADLAANAAESTILIPDDYHELIATGMEPYILKARDKRNESIAAKNEFIFELQEMIDELSERDDTRMIAQLPNDTNLQFGQ